MALMDRIYCKSFLDKSYPDQMAVVEHVRVLRSSAINAAMSAKLTKSAKKNIAKGRTKKRKPKDQTKVARAALSKLSPEQIQLIKAQFNT